MRRDLRGLGAHRRSRGLRARSGPSIATPGSTVPQGSHARPRGRQRLESGRRQSVVCLQRISHTTERRRPTSRRDDVHFRPREPPASVPLDRKPHGAPRWPSAPREGATTPRESSSSRCPSPSSTYWRASFRKSPPCSISRPSPTSPASGSRTERGAAPTPSGASGTATAPRGRACCSWSSSPPSTPTWPGASCATWAWRPGGCAATDARSRRAAARAVHRDPLGTTRLDRARRRGARRGGRGRRGAGAGRPALRRP